MSKNEVCWSIYCAVSPIRSLSFSPIMLFFYMVYKYILVIVIWKTRLQKAARMVLSNQQMHKRWSNSVKFSILPGSWTGNLTAPGLFFLATVWPSVPFASKSPNDTINNAHNPIQLV